MTNQNEEQFIEQVLKAEKIRIVPSRALLSKILERIPAIRGNRIPFGSRLSAYFRVMVPAGVVAIALILSITTHQKTKRINTEEMSQAFDITAIQAESNDMTTTLNDLNQYFDQEAALPDVDQALANF